MKDDARWVAVKPHPDALIVNIGDLFQVSVRPIPAPPSFLHTRRVRI
jgi:hypothetical protein